MGLIVIDSGQEVVIAQKSIDSTERNNFQLAQKLKEEKTKLINALSRFPITALWLLNKYEQNCHKIRKTHRSAEVSELINNLGDIKKYFLLTSSLFSGKEMEASAYDDGKQHLKSALTQFPYSFEDLIKLVDIIVFAYKYRGLSYQPQNNGVKNSTQIIIKRLEGIGRRTEINSAKFSKLVRASEDFNCDEQFLLLSIGEMPGYFNDVVLSEHFWLDSRKQLTNTNTRLVLFIANQYKSSFLSFDDLVQEGQVGLIKAVDRFDYRLGFQFSTYASYWIRQAISRALSRSERVVRVPCGQVANINKVYRAKEEICSKFGNDVSVKELADYTKFTENEINTILSISQTILPLENFDDDEENPFSPIDFLEQQVFPHPLAKIAENELENLIAKALKMLSFREAKIICCHFGIDCDNEMTLQDIGAELNLTRERIRQIQVKALNKLKQNYGQQLLSFL